MSMNIHHNKLRAESGQTMTEYGVALGVISIGVVLALTSLSAAIIKTIERVTGFFS